MRASAEEKIAKTSAATFEVPRPEAAAVTTAATTTVTLAAAKSNCSSISE